MKWKLSKKNFSATTTITNPYQSLPATGLSRIITKKAARRHGRRYIQYYNHIDAIRATSFVEKCRNLRMQILVRDRKQREFKQEEGIGKTS